MEKENMMELELVLSEHLEDIKCNLMLTQCEMQKVLLIGVHIICVRILMIGVTSLFIGFFWHITDIDREHAYTCKTVPGTRSLHSIRSIDHIDWVLHIREHACYCLYCMRNEFQDPCVNIQQGFVEEWRQTIL